MSVREITQANELTPGELGKLGADEVGHHYVRSVPGGHLYIIKAFNNPGGVAITSVFVPFPVR